MHAIEVLSAFADKIQQEPLPAEVCRHAKRALIDWYAAAYPGASDPAVGILRSLLLDEPACDAADLVAGARRRRARLPLSTGQPRMPPNWTTAIGTRCTTLGPQPSPRR